MKSRVFAVAAAFSLASVAIAAQDREVKTETKVEADDDATVVSLTGCLRHDALTDRYTLVGATKVAGEEVRTRTEVDTDVDGDEVDVRARTRSEADDPVGTSGGVATYVVIPKGDIALKSHVDRNVQVSAVMLKPGEDDAKVKIEDRTEVERENAPDADSRTKVKIEVENVPHGQYAIVAVKPLGSACAR